MGFLVDSTRFHLSNVKRWKNISDRTSRYPLNFLEDFQTFPLKTMVPGVRASNTCWFSGSRNVPPRNFTTSQVNEFLPRTHCAGATWLKGGGIPPQGGTKYPRIWYLEYFLEPTIHVRSYLGNFWNT